MRKLLSVISLTVVLILLLVSVLFCVYGIYDINHVLNALASDPGASGMDYMGIGWGYGVGLFLLSVFGLIFSMVSMKAATLKVPRYISCAAIFLFVLLMIAAVYLFYV